MEEMKKDEALEEQQTTAEAAEATEAEAVQAEEIPDAVDETAEKIAKLEQQAADNLDKYQRTLAEFDNFRKRTIKEKAVMYDDGVRSTIEKLLTVIDNLERAVAVQEGKVDADDAFFKGVKMTLVQFREILHSMGVEEIKACVRSREVQAIIELGSSTTQYCTVIFSIHLWLLYLLKTINKKPTN